MANSKTIHVVLDIDETLIHAVPVSYEHYRKHKNRPPKGVVYTKIYDSNTDIYAVHIRPYVHEFLRQIFGMSQSVSIWSAGTRKYVNTMVNLIFSPLQQSKLRIMWNRKNCSIMNGGYYVKKLSKLFKKYQDMTEHNTFLIDDMYMVHRMGNKDMNVLPIIPYNPKKEAKLSEIRKKQKSKIAFQNELRILRYLKRNMKQTESRKY